MRHQTVTTARLNGNC